MRNIDKLPETPHFDEKLVRMISDLLFLNNRPFNSYDFSTGLFRCPIYVNDRFCGGRKLIDYWPYNMEAVLQIMGNIAFLKDMFCGDYSLNIKDKYLPGLPRLIITGGIQPEYKNDTEETRFVKKFYTEKGKYDWNDVLTRPQSVIIKSRLQDVMYNFWSGRDILLDTKSTNTKENITIPKESGWYNNIKHLRLFTTAESALRVLATAKKYLPSIHDIATITYMPTLPELNIRVDKQNWALHPLSQRYVYGELLRVIEYDKTGEIQLSHKSKKKLRNIVDELRAKQK